MDIPGVWQAANPGIGAAVQRAAETERYERATFAAGLSTDDYRSLIDAGLNPDDAYGEVVRRAASTEPGMLSAFGIEPLPRTLAVSHQYRADALHHLRGLGHLTCR